MLLRRRYALGELTDVVVSLAAHLRQHLASWGMFVLLLRGELGSGKTTTARHLLYELGLDPQVAVVSPTYTYACSYPSHHGTIMHVDLYRHRGCFDEMNMAMGSAAEPTAGWLIEWPQMMGDELAMLLRMQLKAAVVFELALGYVNPLPPRQGAPSQSCASRMDSELPMAGDDELRDITFARRHLKL